MRLFVILFFITLCYIKDSGCLWMAAYAFGTYQFTVLKTTTVVCKAINNILDHLYHWHFPRNKEERRSVGWKSEMKFGVPTSICLH